MTACRSCTASIWWAVTKAGKRMPIDPDPTIDGNVVLTGRHQPSQWGAVPEVEVVSTQPAMFADPDDRARYRSHFATCPDADTWKGPRP